MNVRNQKQCVSSGKKFSDNVKILLIPNYLSLKICLCEFQKFCLHKTISASHHKCMRCQRKLPTAVKPMGRSVTWFTLREVLNQPSELFTEAARERGGVSRREGDNVLQL